MTTAINNATLRQAGFAMRAEAISRAILGALYGDLHHQKYTERDLLLVKNAQLQNTPFVGAIVVGADTWEYKGHRFISRIVTAHPELWHEINLHREKWTTLEDTEITPVTRALHGILGFTPSAVDQKQILPTTLHKYIDDCKTYSATREVHSPYLRGEELEAMQERYAHAIHLMRLRMTKNLIGVL
jgi:hypothetical protein